MYQKMLKYIYLAIYPSKVTLSYNTILLAKLNKLVYSITYSLYFVQTKIK